MGVDRESEYIQGYYNNLTTGLLKAWPAVLFLIFVIYWISA